MATEQLYQRNIKNIPYRNNKKLSTSTTTFIAALLPLTKLIELNLVGILFLQDIVAIVLFPIMLMVVPNKKRLIKPMLPLLFLSLVWLAGAILTDIWVGSAPEDLARGWAKISLFIVHASVLFLLARGNIRILAIYLIGLGLADVVSATLSPNQLQQIQPWKFGLGRGCLMISVGLVVFLGSKTSLLRWLPLALVGIIALISLFLNARSLFGVALLSILYALGAALLVSRPAFQRVLNPKSFFLVILLGLLLGQIFISGYGKLAQQGVFGDEARSKYEMQTADNMSLLQGGRPESIVSVQAIKDSPIIGHGSWARDMYYTDMYFYELKQRGLVADAQFYNFNKSQDGLIPSHSHLLGAWVETGILGVAIWIYALILAFKSLYAVLKLGALPGMLVTAIAFSVFWDVLFSPFASDGRIWMSAYLCILIALTHSLRLRTSVATARD